ncbi:hypothetical protein [Rhizobium leguminosarum]|uniref:hypothetical protein n=1 Tax=Rhizobium leguminosarum TaxID=384 RepID=UPI0014423FF2|nr:hypothetical protein [Rhizobium leguminosarum]NKL87332.1 hypothetical protein [Rhizobium leguminosarum bv. viciae]NKM94188.1 hypothetical protein [Rhizobium leguminosarum bv. viciae]
MIDSCQLRRDLNSLPVLATIRYWWWWASHDLAYLMRIGQTGAIDAQLVKSIAKDYGIARGIRKEENDPDGEISPRRATRIAEAVNRRGRGFRACEGLTDRFTLCLEIVTELNGSHDESDRLTHNDFVSGVTKLSWFIAPQGWTMFDRLAAEALGIKSGTARKKAAKFYERLTKVEFIGLAKEMNAALDHNGLAAEHFHAERIVDQYLWLSASNPVARSLVIDKVGAFLDAIGSEQSRRLLKMGEMIEGGFEGRLQNLISERPKTSRKK